MEPWRSVASRNVRKTRAQTAEQAAVILLGCNRGLLLYGAAQSEGEGGQRQASQRCTTHDEPRHACHMAWPPPRVPGSRDGRFGRLSCHAPPDARLARHAARDPRRPPSAFTYIQCKYICVCTRSRVAVVEAGACPQPERTGNGARRTTNRGMHATWTGHRRAYLDRGTVVTGACHEPAPTELRGRSSSNARADAPS